jgi:hypothetical protein
MVAMPLMPRARTSNRCIAKHCDGLLHSLAPNLMLVFSVNRWASTKITSMLMMMMMRKMRMMMIVRPSFLLSPIHPLLLPLPAGK